MLLQQFGRTEVLDWMSQDAELVFVQEKVRCYHGKISDLRLPLSHIAHHWIKMKRELFIDEKTYITYFQEEKLTEDLFQLE